MEDIKNNIEGDYDDRERLLSLAVCYDEAGLGEEAQELWLKVLALAPLVELGSAKAKKKL